MGVSFKVAELLDVELLLELMREFYAFEAIPFAEQAARHALEGLLADQGLGGVWLIQRGGEPVGYLVVTFGYSLEMHGRDAFVDELYIRADHRGQGLGTQALRFAEGVCRANGVHALHLEVDRDNATAQKVYARAGFADRNNYLLTKWLQAESPSGG